MKSEAGIRPVMKRGWIETIYEYLFTPKKDGARINLTCSVNTRWTGRSNGPAMEKECRRFVIMGFNYERSVKEMVHDGCGSFFRGV